jgi:hypothetical protein
VKDALSAFGSEIFRPLVTLLLPGAVSVSTWLIAGVMRNDVVAKFVQVARSESIAALVLLMLFMGLLCEEVGSHLEERFDRRRNRRDGKHKDIWHRYLRVAFRIEPVGQHYLRTVLLRLKFELGCLFGIIPALVGLWFTPIALYAHLAWTAGGLVLIGFFLNEAWASHELLGEIREQLLNGVFAIPAELPRAEENQAAMGHSA